MPWVARQKKHRQGSVDPVADGFQGHPVAATGLCRPAFHICPKTRRISEQWGWPRSNARLLKYASKCAIYENIYIFSMIRYTVAVLHIRKNTIILTGCNPN